MKVVVQPEAEAEILDAAIWYDEKSKVVRQQFLRAVEAALAVIEQHTHRYQKVFGQVRRVVLRRFPFSVLYTVTEHEVNVIACFHGRRNPKRWQRRLPE